MHLCLLPKIFLRVTYNQTKTTKVSTIKSISDIGKHTTFLEKNKNENKITIIHRDRWRVLVVNRKECSNLCWGKWTQKGQRSYRRCPRASQQTPLSIPVHFPSIVFVSEKHQICIQRYLLGTEGRHLWSYRMPH